MWDYLGGDNGNWGDLEEIKKPSDQDPFYDIGSHSHEKQASEGKTPAEAIFDSMDAFDRSRPEDKAPKEDPFKSFGL